MIPQDNSTSQSSAPPLSKKVSKVSRPVSSPSRPPSYTSGAVQSVRPPAAPQVSYATRLAAYNKARNSFMGGLNKSNVKINEGYQSAINKYKGDLDKAKKNAMSLYGKNYKNYTNQFGMSKAGLEKQRGSDIDSITQDYANRGIRSSSGIHQQALADYETGYSGRLKDVQSSYEQSVAKESKARDSAIGSAAAATKAGQTAAAKRKAALLAANKKKAAAYDKKHVKPV